MEINHRLQLVIRISLAHPSRIMMAAMAVDPSPFPSLVALCGVASRHPAG